MLYNEEEIIRICEKYGIDMVETKGYPLYKGKEMDKDFSVRDVMNEPIQIIEQR